MAKKCLRPGCTNTLATTGVCVSCANSDYEPQKDGVQFRDSNGQFVTTDPESRGRRGVPSVPIA